ncbi:MAG: hypothetical protein COA79_16810 [Planctomycetota bacterium]|nr:MAG: hypothetical protein COA79_16810 [Planctomycetota bacterium]
MPKVFWGIDIGSSSVKAVKAEAINGKLTLLDCVFYPIASAENDSEILENNYEATLSALQMLVKDKQLEGASVGISISGKSVFSRYFNLPPVDNVEELIPLEAKMQIPFPLDEVVWDYHIFGMNEETLETDVAIFAVKKDIIENVLELGKAVKLDIQVIQSSAFAVLNFGVIEFGLENPLVMLEGGSKNIDIVICNAMNFWPRSLPISGITFTNALESKFQIPFEEAEKLKIQLKESEQSDRIFKIIEPSLKELLGEFQRSIGFFRSQRKELNINEVCLTGNALRIPGLDQYLTTGISKPAKYIDEPINVEIAESEGEFLLSEGYGSFAIAIGLAAQGVDLGFVKINFVPKSLLLQKMLKRKMIYVIGCIVALSIALGLGWYDVSASKGSIKSIKKNATKVHQRYAGIPNTFDGKVRSLKSKEKSLGDYRKLFIKENTRFQVFHEMLKTAVEEVDLFSLNMGKEKTKKDKKEDTKIDPVRSIWLKDIKSNWMKRKDAVIKSEVDAKGMTPELKFQVNKKKVLRVVINGLTQHAEKKGLELLKKFNDSIDEYKINNHLLLMGNTKIPQSGEKEEIQRKVVKPNLFLKSKDAIDKEDFRGLERFDDAAQRIASIKDVKSKFFEFNIVFFVDFEVLNLKMKEPISKK